MLAEPARARASVRLYRTFLAREVARGPRGRLRVPTRIVVGRRDPAIPAVLLEGAQDDADDVAVEIVPDAGISSPRSTPSSSPSAHARSSACIDQETWSEGLVHTSSGCSQAA